MLNNDDIAHITRLMSHATRDPYATQIAVAMITGFAETGRWGTVKDLRSMPGMKEYGFFRVCAGLDTLEDLQLVKSSDLILRSLVNTSNIWIPGGIMQIINGTLVAMGRPHIELAFGGSVQPFLPEGEKGSIQDNIRMTG